MRKCNLENLYAISGRRKTSASPDKQGVKQEIEFRAGQRAYGGDPFCFVCRIYAQPERRIAQGARAFLARARKAALPKADQSGCEVFLCQSAASPRSDNEYRPMN
jgi:hypothetical protein